MVNFDPDLMLHCNGVYGFQQSDASHFYSKLRTRHQIPDSELKILKQVQKEHKSHYDNLGLEKKLINAIPPSLHDSALKDVRIRDYICLPILLVLGT